MFVGIDFDNTIVSYDSLFHRACLAEGLIPATTPANKSAVRDYLRSVGREDRWTEMQGEVYGRRMAEAEPFPGVLDFFKACKQSGIKLAIVSHKTPYPYRGERHDFHAAAYRWLERYGFFDPEGIGLNREDVFFELSKAEKLQRIGAIGCDVFIDDLPEVLSDAAFPQGVNRILFDPAAVYTADVRYPRSSSWPELTKVVGAHAVGCEISHELVAAINGLLEPHHPDKAVEITSVTGGRNNRVYRVHGLREPLFAKAYFTNAADSRDRFAAEKRFYALLDAQGGRSAPRPVGWDAVHRLGVFSFVTGRKLDAAEIDRSAVDAALAFLIDVNAHRHSNVAASVDDASEACFSVRAHVQLVERRVDRMGELRTDTPVATQASEFVQRELKPLWHSVREATFEDCERAGIAMDHELTRAERCLSPSDFGFHNAIRRPDGSLAFFDFEYAGWDDPAKLTCDFFCQPQLPVPQSHWDHVVSRVLSGLEPGREYATRAALLFPVYQLKWCCIMLNDFLATESARRSFAQPALSPEDARTRQLAAAIRLSKNVARARL